MQSDLNSFGYSGNIQLAESNFERWEELFFELHSDCCVYLGLGRKKKRDSDWEHQNWLQEVPWESME